MHTVLLVIWHAKIFAEPRLDSGVAWDLFKTFLIVLLSFLSNDQTSLPPISSSGAKEDTGPSMTQSPARDPPRRPAKALDASSATPLHDHE